MRRRGGAWRHAGGHRRCRGREQWGGTSSRDPVSDGVLGGLFDLGRGGLGLGFRCLIGGGAGERIGGAQHDAGSAGPGLDPAGNLALGDPGQHLGVRRRWLGPEVPIIGGEVAEVFRNRLHRGKGVSKPSSVHEKVP